MSGFELSMSDAWKIDGTPIYSPSSCSLGITNLQILAERATADGMLHKETIRYGVVKGITFGYDLMSQEQIETLCKLAMQEKEFFHLTYLDFKRGLRTIECYANDFDAELSSAVSYGGLWVNVKFTCVER